MSNALRFLAQFADQDNRGLEIRIYQEGYTGSVTNLTCGASPFVVTEDDDESPFYPIRTSTAKMTLIQQNRVLDDLVAKNAHEWEVLLSDASTSACLWRGYLKPESWTQSWLPEPYEVEFTCVSMLSALEAYELSTSAGFDVVTIGGLLAESLELLGDRIDTVYLPKEFDIAPSRTAAEGLSTLFNALQISRWNFFSANDEEKDSENASSYEPYTRPKASDVLEQICKFFGWSLYERGTNLYFVSRFSDTYVSLSGDDFLQALENGTTLSVDDETHTDYTISKLQLMSTDHSIDVLKGYKRVSVSTKINKVGELSPEIGNYIPLFTAKNQKTGTAELLTYVVHSMFPTTGNSRFHLFDPNSMNATTGVYDEVTVDPANLSTFLTYFGAVYVQEDMYTVDELNGTNGRAKKINYNFAPAIFISFYAATQSGDAIIQDKNGKHWFIDLYSENPAMYTRGCFCISAQTTAFSYYLSTEANFSGRGKIGAELSVGSSYWDGSAWQDEQCSFDIQIVDTNSVLNSDGKYTIDATQEQGQIVNTKTLDMPYNGLEGTIIPIKNVTLSGKIHFRMNLHYRPNAGTTADTGGDMSNGGTETLIFKDFKIEYQDEDGYNYTKTTKSEHLYEQNTNQAFADEADAVELKIGSYNNDPAAYSTVFQSGTPLESWYDYPLKKMIRPERSLLARLVNVFGNTRRRLTLDVKSVDRRPPIDLYYDANDNNTSYRVLSVSTDYKKTKDTIILGSYEQY